MNCDEFRREALFLASGEVDGPEFQEHLEACPGCRKELEKARDLHGLLKEAFDGLSPTEGFERRTAIRETHFPETTRKRRAWFLWLSGAAAAFFAVLSLVLALELGKKSAEFLEEELGALKASLLEEAQSRVDGKKPLEALAILNVLSEQAPSEEVLRLRARACLAIEDFTGVIADTTSLINEGKASAEDYLLRSLAYERTGQRDPASRDRTEARKRDPMMMQRDFERPAARAMTR